MKLQQVTKILLYLSGLLRVLKYLRNLDRVTHEVKKILIVKKVLLYHVTHYHGHVTQSYDTFLCELRIFVNVCFKKDTLLNLHIPLRNF